MYADAESFANVGTGGDAIPNGGGNVLQNADENVGIGVDATPYLIPNNEEEGRQGWTRGLIVEVGTNRERYGWARWVRPDETRIMTFYIDTINSFRLQQ